MYYLQRITTEYEEIEDRFKLTVMSEKGEKMSFWMTQRLLTRLSKACIEWIENQSPDIAKKVANTESRDTALGLVQQSAKNQIRKEKRVEAESSSPNILVKEVDLKFAENGIEFIFKEGTNRFVLVLNTHHLRQWLAIIYSLWHKAEWPDSHWPKWINTEGAKITTSKLVH